MILWTQVMLSQTLHYKKQRDLLAYYLLKTGIKKSQLGKILGISSSAVSLQFPTKKNDK